MICARRACLSRSFRSAIRFAASFVAIDRKYSAARISGRTVNLSQMLCIISSVARFSRNETFYAQRYSAHFGGSPGCGDHCYRLFLPCISGTFGLKPPASDADTRAWLRPKGIRDVVAGLVVLAMMLTVDSRAVGIALLVEAVIPFGDMSIILGSGGSKSRAFSIHGVTCAVMLVVGLLLIHAV